MREQKTKNKNGRLSSNISIIILSTNIPNIQLKDRDWQSRLKNMTQLYIAYKELTANIIRYIV